MALNPDFVGRKYAVPDIFEVGREHIRSFALSYGDDNPLYLDGAAAKAAGYSDVIAPPTFLTTLGFRFRGFGPINDPELGLNYSMVVHGEQKFAMVRPVVAGDRLGAVLQVREIRTVGRNEVLSLEMEISDESGGPVATMTQVIVSRGTAAAKES